MNNPFVLALVMLALGLIVGYFAGRVSKEEQSIRSKFMPKIENSRWRVGFLLRDGQTRMTGEMNLREALLRIQEEKAGAYICKVVGVVWKDEMPTAEKIKRDVEIELGIKKD